MNPEIPLLDLTREYRQIATELAAQWERCLESMHLLNGEQVRAFEREIAAFVGVPHACGVASGTDALLLSMAALGIGRGDRVILAANGFIAALEAVHHLGAIPVLVDAERDGFAPDIDAIEAALPARAVIVVHLYGYAFRLIRLLELCAPHGTSLIEDGSHSHGARRGGRRVGSFGAVGCFSAGVVKNLAAYGDAGFVTTARDDVARELRLLRQHGQAEKNRHVCYGRNCRLDELQAAVLRIKLRRIETRNARRRAIAAFYDDQFDALGIAPPPPEPDEEPVYHQYVIRSPSRDRLRAHLDSLGVRTGIHYPESLHRQPAWRSAYGDPPRLPRAERLAREVLSLPVFPDLTDAEVERVAAGVHSFYRG